MKTGYIILVFVALILFGGLTFFISQPNINLNFENPILGVETKSEENKNNELIEDKISGEKLKEATSSALIYLPKYNSQTFNNCGPANLSMVLNYLGTQTTQEKIAQDLRPFNTPNGGVDDKSVYNSEMASYAKQLGYESIVRPNGSIEKLKLFVTNGIPVTVSAWLHPNEDIGHYRLVKGFDESKKIIITDDSYTGPNQTLSYEQFNDMWKPFNYTYLIVYPEEKSEIVNQILGDEVDQNISFQKAIQLAQNDLLKNPDDTYAKFNISTSQYYLGNFAESVKYYEQIATKLPGRMLWYQYEPILAFQQLGDDAKVITMADNLLNNANIAFSEMYQLKGEVYLKQGNKELAKDMFEKAIYYNKNYDKPKESLKNL